MKVSELAENDLKLFGDFLAIFKKCQLPVGTTAADAVALANSFQWLQALALQCAKQWEAEQKPKPFVPTQVLPPQEPPKQGKPKK